MSFDPNTPTAATPAAPAASTPAPASVAQPTTPAPTSNVAPASPATPAPTQTEDRSNWVPPYRLRETTTKYESAIANERARFEAEKVALQRQIQALTGTLPPKNPEIDQVRNQFQQVFPELHELGSQADAIKEILAMREELRASMEHQWASHNRTAINTLYRDAEATYGTPLTDEAKRTLGAAFIGYLQSNPDEYARYQQDPTVVQDFWKAFTDRFISPIQRAQTVATAGRVPQGIPQDPMSGSVPVSAPAPKPGTQDERLEAALAHYKANLKQGF